MIAMKSCYSLIKIKDLKILPFENFDCGRTISFEGKRRTETLLFKDNIHRNFNEFLKNIQPLV